MVAHGFTDMLHVSVANWFIYVSVVSCVAIFLDILLLPSVLFDCCLRVADIVDMLIYVTIVMCYIGVLSCCHMCY